MKKHKRELFTDALHIFVLFSFALVQPLLEITSRNAEFFVAHDSRSVDIILLLLLLCFLLPGIIVLCERAAGLFGITTRKTAHYIIVACLFAVTALVILKKQFAGTTGTYLLASSAATGMILTVLYSRIRHVRNFLTVLSPLILIFPSLFLFNSPIFKIVFPEKRPSAVTVKAENAVPIIMIIFDEFNLTTLMNEDHEIDHIRYPNFAALADDSNWFRNATTVSESTDKAVPAILTGIYPDPAKIPIASDHPGNIFTLLGGSYNLKVTEAVTQLCPESLCRDARERLSKRMVSVMSDLSLVFLHIVLPPDLSSDVPAVTRNWKDFNGSSVRDSKRNKDTWSFKEHAEDTLVEQDRAGEFRDFINSIYAVEKPTLYFMHTMLPHYPYIYLPSGKTYNATGFRGMAEREKWGSSEEAIIPDYQGYMFQVGFVDSLLGNLLSHLKEIGLYDRSLIVVTADHGVSFRPDDFRRPLSKTNYQDIMPVPLFIKIPKQRNGVISDRNVETVDILPTVADILGIRIPWSLDGRSALDTSMKERSKQVIYFNNARERLEADSASIDAKYSTLERMLALFGSGATPDGLYKAGPYSSLVGQRIDQTEVAKASDYMIELDMARFYENMDPESNFIPVQISGRILDIKGEGVPYNLAISVNGTIYAVTRTFYNTANFSTILPEEVFRKGRNDVDIFLVSGSEGHPRIAATNKHDLFTYTTSETVDKEEAIISSSGESFPVIPHGIKGYIDMVKVKNDMLYISGWAADIEHGEYPESILVFAQEKFFYRGATGVDRPDIVNVFGSDALVHSGFNYALPFVQSDDMTPPDVRVFAVSKEGKASELMPAEPPATYILTATDKGDEVIISSDGHSIPVVAEALQGHMDKLRIDKDGVLVSGWAADIEHSETPEKIIIFAYGSFFYAAPCNRERYDVVKEYNNIMLKRSGFAFRFNIRISEDDISEARFFAVSERGVASELIYPEGYKWGRKTL